MPLDLTQERYDRLKAAKLTRYSLEEILTAAQEYETAEAEVKALYAEATAQITNFLEEEERTLGVPEGSLRTSQRRIEMSLNAAMTVLNDAMKRTTDATTVAIQKRNSALRCGGDLFAVRSWRRAAASQRQAARRLKNALQALEKK